MKTELGAYLDPLADKVLIVSIYVTLGITGVIPLLARHPGGVARHHDRRRHHPVLGGGPAGQDQAALVVASSTPGRRSCSPAWCWRRYGIRFDAEPVLTLVMALVAVLTLLSVGLYLAEWVRHMGSAEAGR